MRARKRLSKTKSGLMFPLSQSSLRKSTSTSKRQLAVELSQLGHPTGVPISHKGRDTIELQSGLDSPQYRIRAESVEHSVWKLYKKVSFLAFRKAQKTNLKYAFMVRKIKFFIRNETFLATFKHCAYVVVCTIGKNSNFPDMKKRMSHLGIEPGTSGLRDLPNT